MTPDDAGAGDRLEAFVRRGMRAQKAVDELLPVPGPNFAAVIDGLRADLETLEEIAARLLALRERLTSQLAELERRADR